MGISVKVDELIQEINENVEGLEAFFLLNNQAEILFQRVVKNIHNSPQLSSLLIKTIMDSKLETHFSKIKFATLEGINTKLILSYLPDHDIYICIVGSNKMISGIVQIYLTRMAEILDKDWRSKLKTRS